MFVLNVCTNLHHVRDYGVLTVDHLAVAGALDVAATLDKIYLNK